MHSISSDKRKVRTTLPKKHVRMISGVCSECGTTYEVEARGGNEEWLCPRCGPSTPIDMDNSVGKSRRRGRWRRRRIRVPFFLLQLLIVCLTFALFMVFIVYYMDFTGAARTAPRMALSLKRGTPLVAKSDGPAQASVATDLPAESASANTELPTGGENSSAASETTTNPGAVEGAESLATTKQIDSRSSKTILTGDDFDLPMGVEANSISVRSVLSKLIQFFGRQFQMQCQLVGVHDDAAGRVPHRFEVDGESYTLADEDDGDYLRLEIVDIAGQQLDSLFVERNGQLRRKLDWLRAGDWIVVSATPGVRYQDGSASGAVKWGLMLTDITALSQHTHQSRSEVSKKVAER